MIKNGKYFVSPETCDSDFKAVFKRLASVGAGRPVDTNGFSEGPWTPELLADAISRVDANQSDVDLRTVQLWFQDNDRGISSENLRWLARIFGCDDPEATSAWQAKLSTAQARLVAERRKRRAIQVVEPAAEPSADWTKTAEGRKVQRAQSFSVAKLSEAMFLEGRPFSAIVFLWACVALLIFVSYIVGTHVVTYEPLEGVSKQVGLFWSPNWILDKLIWLPLIVMVVSAAVTHWRDEWRTALTSDHLGRDEKNEWEYRIHSFSIAFWGISLVSLTIVFLLQWYGAYVRPLLQNSAGDRVVDWLLVAIERPEVISVPEALAISAFANLLSGIAYWFLFAGLMLLYIMATDFGDLCSKLVRFSNVEVRRMALSIGMKIVQATYCATTLAVLIATQIKLVAVFLMTDAENLLTWLIGDAGTFLGYRSDEWSWFEKSPSASITSFFVLFIPCFVFFACYFHVKRAVGRLSPVGTVSGTRFSGLGLIAVVLLLMANFFLLGQFVGFSVLLFVSISTAIGSLIYQGLIVTDRHKPLQHSDPINQVPGDKGI